MFWVVSHAAERSVYFLKAGGALKAWRSAPGCQVMVTSPGKELKMGPGLSLWNAL